MGGKELLLIADRNEESAGRISLEVLGHKPQWWTKSGSDLVMALHDRLRDHKNTKHKKASFFIFVYFTELCSFHGVACLVRDHWSQSEEGSQQTWLNVTSIKHVTSTVWVTDTDLHLFTNNKSHDPTLLHDVIKQQLLFLWRQKLHTENLKTQ